jgi:hypothetical protein
VAVGAGEAFGEGVGVFEGLAARSKFGELGTRALGKKWVILVTPAAPGSFF